MEYINLDVKAIQNKPLITLDVSPRVKKISALALAMIALSVAATPFIFSLGTMIAAVWITTGVITFALSILLLISDESFTYKQKKITSLIRKDPLQYKNLSLGWKADKEVAETAFFWGSGELLLDAPESIKNDLKLVEMAVGKDPNSSKVYSSLSKKLQNDHSILLKFIRAQNEINDISAFKSAIEIHKEDSEVVNALLNNSSPEIVQILVEQYKDNSSFLINAIKIDPKYYSLASDEVKKNKDVLICYIKQVESNKSFDKTVIQNIEEILLESKKVSEDSEEFLEYSEFKLALLKSPVCEKLNDFGNFYFELSKRDQLDFQYYFHSYLKETNQFDDIKLNGFKKLLLALLSTQSRNVTFFHQVEMSPVVLFLTFYSKN